MKKSWRYPISMRRFVMVTCEMCHSNGDMPIEEQEVPKASTVSRNRIRCWKFSCLHLRRHLRYWPMAYLMTFSDWLMSCQAWLPRDRYGQWARCKHWRPAVYFLYKMACFNGVYLKYRPTNSTGISIWHKNRCLLYWYKISRWYDEKLLCCRRVKICEFT